MPDQGDTMVRRLQNIPSRSATINSSGRKRQAPNLTLYVPGKRTERRTSRANVAGMHCPLRGMVGYAYTSTAYMRITLVLQR